MRKNLASRGLVLLVLAVAGSALPTRVSHAADTTPYLASPNLLNPVNRVLQNPDPPVFHWTGIPGAISYTVQVASDPGFTNTVASTSTANTRFTPTGTLANGTYYWRLRAQGNNNQLSLYVNASFSVNWRGAPQPITPAKGASVRWGRDTFVFSWTPQPYAAAYNLQISTSRLFPDAAFQGTTPNLSFAVPGTALRNDQTYYWRVQGVDGAGHPGYFSVPQAFTKVWHPTPQIQYLARPKGRAPVSVNDPVLNWKPVDGAVKYQLQISTDVQLAGGVDQDTPPPSSITVDDTTPLPFYVPKQGGLLNGDYIWHVRGIDASNNAGPWSKWVANGAGAYRFIVAAPAPSAPISPANGATIIVPRLRWKAVPYASTYQVQTSSDPNFSKANTNIFPTYTNVLSPGQWTPAPFINVRYYWRVRAVAGNGKVGRWSTDITGVPWSFIFSSGGPAVALSPVNNQQVETPVFTWSHVPQADHYEVVIRDGVTRGFTTTTTLNTTFTPPDATLLNDCATAGCYWYVRAVLADGNREPTPDSSTFGSFVNTPLAKLPLYTVAVPVRPLPGDAPSTEMPSFCWRAAQGAVNYQLFYSTGADTFQPLTAQTTPAICQTPTFNLPDGSYKWFVRALDKNNGPVSDGPVSSFTIQSNLLSSSPGKGCSLLSTDYLAPQASVLNVYQPEFLWNSIPCAHGYHIYVASDPTFTNIIDEQPDYPYTVYLPKTPYFPGYTTIYFLVRPILGSLEPQSGTAATNTIEVPPDVTGAFNGIKITLSAPRPVLASPGNNSTIPTTPLFHWNQYQQAAAYELQVSQAPDLSGTLAISATILASSYAPSANLPDGTYFWRIRAVSSSNQELPWSQVYHFAKRSPVPALYGPADGATITSTPVFTWQPLQQAAQYELQVSNNDPTFTSTLTDTVKVGSSAYVPTTLYGLNATAGYLYWRVRIIDANSNVGPWSPSHHFHLSYDYPLLLKPDRGVTLGTPYQVFNFKTLRGAASYTIEFSTVPDFSTISQTIATQSTNWTPQTPLAPGTYYWRVQPSFIFPDANGAYTPANTVVGLPSIARIFTVPVPPPPPTATPTPAPATPTPTPAPTTAAAKVVITNAFTVDASGKPATTFPVGVKMVDYQLSWDHARVGVDSFQTFIFVSAANEVNGEGSVVKFPAVSGTQARVVFISDKTTKKQVPFNKGSYRISIHLNGTEAKSLSFTVK